MRYKHQIYFLKDNLSEQGYKTVFYRHNDKNLVLVVYSPNKVKVFTKSIASRANQFSNIKASLNNNCNTETHVCGRIRDNIKVDLNINKHLNIKENKENLNNTNKKDKSTLENVMNNKNNNQIQNSLKLKLNINNDKNERIELNTKIRKSGQGSNLNDTSTVNKEVNSNTSKQNFSEEINLNNNYHNINQDSSESKIKRKPKEMKSFKNNIQSDSLIPAENLGEPYNYGDINNKKR
ncbi:hypothetical protein H8356DRAFT_1323704 [Neocallimastix lanati (nom. inval.)]|nr:hypothetical protein H8356DRAFT_1323704 [Neocallimastix sp. JGI-2020a]